MVILYQFLVFAGFYGLQGTVCGDIVSHFTIDSTWYMYVLPSIGFLLIPGVWSLYILCWKNPVIQLPV